MTVLCSEATQMPKTYDFRELAMESVQEVDRFAFEWVIRYAYACCLHWLLACSSLYVCV